MAVDMFLKIDSVKGEAQDRIHKDEIDVLAWSWGGTQSGTMRTGGGGRVSIQDLSLTKWVDKASLVLFRYLATGMQFSEAKLTVRKAGGDSPLEYLVVTLKDVIITSLSTGGSGGEDRLTENISLNFASFQLSYQPQKQDGSADGAAMTFGWDIAANVPM